jgi:hypothetical protein
VWKVRENGGGSGVDLGDAFGSAWWLVSLSFYGLRRRRRDAVVGWEGLEEWLEKSIDTQNMSQHVSLYMQLLHYAYVKRVRILGNISFAKNAEAC